tara:strand:+ start:2676 stop:2888 length:213 start_codon:yes stop_codon:yes gene_type:complete
LTNLLLLGVLLNLFQYLALGFGKETNAETCLLLALCLVPYGIMGMYLLIYLAGFLLLAIVMSVILVIERK